ncbi:hypothetical protein N802_18225 [Knoellia sinensis KCTC 19936]|uniref:Transposase n=1 Tax=Knoellia sinensis KCTC 19936 TaxID=1385520 RepID=A0A0A0J9L1_9MICO|nr:DUF6262 family protein [Knoellia sinensis]KGN32301.1 hypothetical protein N802_18225 [Knoellia sinensis KCTC 19936]
MPETAPMAEARRRDSAVKRGRVLRAIEEIEAEGGVITRASITARARVSTHMVYKVPELRAVVDAAITRAQQSAQAQPGAVDAATVVGLRTDLALAREHLKDAQHEVARLRRRLQESLGAEVSTHSQAELVERIHDLEGAVAALNREREETGPQLRRLTDENQELAAQVQAQSDANRLLMRDLSRLSGVVSSPLADRA